MKFSYDIERDTLTLNAWNVDIEIHMNGGDPDVYCIDGYEFSTKCDISHGNHIFHEGGIYSWQDIIDAAMSQYDDIVCETLDEISAENAMADELSSPYWTGRV